MNISFSQNFKSLQKLAWLGESTISLHSEISVHDYLMLWFHYVGYFALHIVDCSYASGIDQFTWLNLWKSCHHCFVSWKTECLNIVVECKVIWDLSECGIIWKIAVLRTQIIFALYCAKSSLIFAGHYHASAEVCKAILKYLYCLFYVQEE